MSLVRPHAQRHGTAINAQFYLHSFQSTMPDLNWRNPAVVNAMLSTLVFWLEQGVDGVRIDVAHMLGQDPALRDNSPAPDPSVNLVDMQHPSYTSQLFGRRQARIAAMLLLTLRGTPVLYYGDELGALDVPPSGTPVDVLGRDAVRAPMPWMSRGHHGFCPDEVKPWLPFAPDSAEINVEGADPGSLLSLYQNLLRVRREHTTLRTGGYERLHLADGCLTYLRTGSSEQFLVALNFASQPCRKRLPWPGTVLVSTRPGEVPSQVRAEMNLLPDAGAVLLADHAERRP